MSDVSTKKPLSHSQRWRLDIWDRRYSGMHQYRGAMLSLHKEINASQPTIDKSYMNSSQEEGDTACCWCDRLCCNKHWYLLDGSRCVIVLALCNYPGQHCAETNFIMKTGKTHRTIQLSQVYDAHERSFILNLALWAILSTIDLSLTYTGLIP